MLPASDWRAVPCDPWPLKRSAGGYGRVYGGGLALFAHRLAYEGTHGVTLASHDHVRHYCDNPPCVEVAHLVAGTHADNMRDMAARGRSANGAALRAACPAGHSYDEPNAYVRANRSGRDCRACARARAARRRVTRCQSA